MSIVNQDWAGMHGATAWHLIDRHADAWCEVGAMMNAWLSANVAIEREACAKVAENACLVDPDGGSPTEEERIVCEEAARRIRARGQQ